MPERISLRHDFDNESVDPAAGSVSSESQHENPSVSAASTTSRNNNVNHNNEVDRRSTNTTRHSSTSTTAVTSEIERRISELRAILPDASDAELRQMVEENDRASNNTRQSRTDAAAAAEQAAASPLTTTQESSTTSLRSSTASALRSSTASASSFRRSRRSWQPCQQAPSRPGVFSVGGPIQPGETYDVGVTDEWHLEMKRIDMRTEVQEALSEKLGYNLGESGKIEAAQQQLKEEGKMLNMTSFDRREKEVLPNMVHWDPPPASRKSLVRKEPTLLPPSKPLQLPLTFGDYPGELISGRFISAHSEDYEGGRREEEKREESFGDEDGEIGPYDQLVRCRKCRACLAVHFEVGLVACPRCTAISPASDVIDIA